MASVYLSSGESFTISNNNASVYGGGGTEVLTVSSGLTGTNIDQNIERVVLGGASSSYTYQQQGNQLVVYSGSSQVAIVPLQQDTDGTLLTFSNGTVSAKVSASGMTFGGATVTAGTTSTTATSVTPTTVDATVTNGTSTTPTFSVTGGSAVSEGSTASFVVSLANRSTGDYTVVVTPSAAGGATAGTDYTSTLTLDSVSTAAGITYSTSTGLLTIPSSSTVTSATLTTAVASDATSSETGEGIAVTLSSASGTSATLSSSATSVTTAITDVPLSYTLTASASSVYEGAAITYTLTASAASSSATTVDFSVVAGDVNAANAGTSTTNMNDFASGAFNPSTATIAAGSKTATFVVTSASDSLTELPENYSVKAVSGTSTLATITTSLLDGTSSTSSSTGTTFTLTSGVDGASSFTGGASADTFNGIHSATASSKTFNSFDVISGGSGSDILNLYAIDYASGDNIDVATASDIETVNFRATDTATSIINLVASNFSGMTTFNDDRSTSSVAVTSLASGTTVGFIGNGAITNDALSAAYYATVTAGTLAISGGTTAGNVALNGTGLTSIAITSSGANNTVGTISSNATLASSVTIAASTALTATGLIIGGPTTASLTISGAATNVAATATTAASSAVNLGALDTDFTSVNASGLTAGGVSATLSATTTATFVGGSGNDSITTSTSGQTGSVDAGAGTADKLVVANTVDVNTTAEYLVYKNFEVAQIGNAVSLDVSLMTGSTFTAVAIAETGGGATATNLSAAQATAGVNLVMASTVTITLNGASVVGTSDTLNLTASDGDSTTSETAITSGFLTIAGVETINITATDDLTLSSMSAVTGLTSLTVSGAGDVVITTGAHAASANESINFSGLTTAASFNFAAATTNAIAFTGGSGIDTVTDSAVAGNVITTKAGKDVISLTDKTTGTGSVTTITGGAAADTVSVAAGGSSCDVLKFVYAAGDSVSDSGSTNGISTAYTDVITNLDGSVLATTTGASVTFDTEVSATSFTYNGATAVTFGSSTVTNAYDFLIMTVSATATVIYQDTDGDKLIESGEFAVSLTGIQNSNFATGEFTISSGNLVITSA